MIATITIMKGVNFFTRQLLILCLITPVSWGALANTAPDQQPPSLADAVVSDVLHERAYQASHRMVQLSKSGLQTGMGKPEPADNLSEVVIDPSTIRGKSGFYRVGRSTTGRWWLLTPNGKPMLYKGCNAVLRQEVGKAGKNMYFQWVERTYGSDHPRFLADAVATLRGAGFNGFGGWSMLFTPNIGHRETGMPFVEILTPRANAKDLLVCGNIDVFDPLTWQQIEPEVKKQTAAVADNPNLVGYFCDNEATYGQPHTDAAWTGKFSDLSAPPSAPTLLQAYLALPEGRAGRDWAWKWVLARYDGDVARLMEYWGVPGLHPDELRRRTDNKTLILASDTYAADHEAFTHAYVREYYKRMHEIIRRFDTNHLIMTTRCPSPPGVPVLREMFACFNDGLIDVLAMNSYRSNLRERIDEFFVHAPMPILIGEFSWASGHFLDWGKFLREEYFNEQEKEQVRRRGRQALERAFTHPALIGYTWFKWYSGSEFTKDAYGLATDQPFGAVINNQGEQNTFNGPLLREIHARLEAIALGHLAPYKAEGLTPLVQTPANKNKQ